MTTPTKKADLEAQMRRKYMRMKTANNHENVKLERTKQDLNKVAVNTLEQHLQKTIEMSDLWTRCSTTTGWFDDAVKPKKRDLRSSMMTDFKVMTKPWMYFKQDTIETWEKRSASNKRRPKTAIGTYTVNASTKQKASNESEIEAGEDKQTPTKRPHTTTGHVRTGTQPQNSLPEDLSPVGGAMLQQRAKSARILFSNISFQSPRLQDKHIKANVRPQRPVTAGALLQSGGSQSEFVEAERKHAQTIHRRKYNPAALDSDEVFETVVSQTYDGTDKPRPMSEKHVTKIEISRPANNTTVDKSQSETDTDPSKAEVETTTAKSPSISFRRRDSVIMASVCAKFQRQKSSTSNKSESKSEIPAIREPKSDGKTEDSEEIKLDDNNKENTVKIPKKKKAKTQMPKWNMPKFYIRPQDRYKTEDMFLMRRYILLQRQLASEMPPNMIESPKLDLNVAFSSSERKKKLNTLVEENNYKLKSDKKTVKEDNMKGRIDKFLTEIDDFIEKQRD